MVAARGRFYGSLSNLLCAQSWIGLVAAMAAGAFVAYILALGVHSL